ncbi:MAG: hypothetical protein Q8L62_09870 [Candidatus Nitrotoga sp.]|nr:hypothetical protein [Candidatus Nitrotoga sp.]
MEQDFLGRVGDVTDTEEDSRNETDCSGGQSNGELLGQCEDPQLKLDTLKNADKSTFEVYNLKLLT